MAKKLTNMTWDEMQKEMSIAGSPEKISNLGKNIWEKIGSEVDFTNGAEIINVEFAIRRIHAEIKQAARIFENRTGQKIHFD